jgi:hypothetical protein
MAAMESARAEAEQRKRKLGGQGVFFTGSEMYDPAYYDSLRERYLKPAKNSIEKLLQSREQVPYDEAWIAAMQFPLVWESDLKEWIDAWK